MTRFKPTHKLHKCCLLTGITLAASLSFSTPLSAQNKGCFHDRTVQERFVICEGSGGIMWRNDIMMRLPGMYTTSDTIANPNGRCDSLIHYEAVLVTYPCHGNEGQAISDKPISWRDPSASDMTTSSVVSTPDGVFVISTKTNTLRPIKSDTQSQQKDGKEDESTLDLSNIDTAAGNVSIMPNPARRGAHVEVEGCDSGVIQLYDAEGRLVRTADIASGITIESRMTRGTYYVKINSRDGASWVRKLEIR